MSTLRALPGLQVAAVAELGVRGGHRRSAHLEVGGQGALARQRGPDGDPPVQYQQAQRLGERDVGRPRTVGTPRAQLLGEGGRADGAS
ncbi:hypothetical protein MTP03_08320 [Tsukamurella sp. PLM1]|nr:hypothetical protein MTP03_08320 [Tsukamurella sp. PLM1]